MSLRLSTISGNRRHHHSGDGHHAKKCATSCPDPCKCYEDDCDECQAFYRNYHCPPRRHYRYPLAWTICAEADFKKGDDIFSKIYIDDPELCFLRWLLRFDECAVNEHIANAVIFYRQNAGIDFSNSQFDSVEGQWVSDDGNFVMKPYYIHRGIGMSLIKDGGLVTGKVHKGGLMVYAVRDAVIGGMWGGDSGLAVEAGTTMDFGLWVIEDHPSTYVLHSQSASPIAPRDNDILPVFEQVAYLDQSCKTSRGLWGMAKGCSFTIESCNACPHFCFRGVITMDSVPDCDPCETWCERDRRTKGESESDSDSDSDDN